MSKKEYKFVDPFKISDEGILRDILQQAGLQLTWKSTEKKTFITAYDLFTKYMKKRGWYAR